MLLVSADPFVSQSNGLFTAAFGVALHCHRPLAVRRLSSSILPTHNSLIASCMILGSSAALNSADVLVSGHNCDRRVPMLCSIETSGSLLVPIKGEPNLISML